MEFFIISALIMIIGFIMVGINFLSDLGAFFVVSGILSVFFGGVFMIAAHGDVKEDLEKYQGLKAQLELIEQDTLLTEYKLDLYDKAMSMNEDIIWCQENNDTWKDWWIPDKLVEERELLELPIEK